MPSYTDGEFTYWAYSATCGDYINLTAYYYENSEGKLLPKYNLDKNGIQDESLGINKENEAQNTLGVDTNGKQKAKPIVEKYYQNADKELLHVYNLDENGVPQSGLGVNEACQAVNVLVGTNKESIQLYADAGFNVLFINWGATAYRSPFEGSLVEKIMDWAGDRNIKCFIYGPFHSLSASHESLINPQKADGVNFFASQADLNAYAATELKGVVDHPAFYGVSLIDEAYYTQFDAMGQVYQAVQSVKPGVFCNMNLNPMSYSWQAMERYCETSYNWVNVDKRTSGFTSAEMEASYVEYLNLYYEKVGKYCGYIGYDSYPMLSNASSNFLYPHIRNAQLVAEYCAKYDMRFGHVYQTCEYSSRRGPDEDEIEWQVNMGLAFGVKDHSYYTYYPVLNSGSLPDEDYTIVNRNGKPNKMYDWVKGLNEDMAVFAKAMAHFEYRDMQYYTKGSVDSSMQKALDIVENVGKFDDKLENVAISANGLALVTELYDEENGWFGYFVMNATNPYTTVAEQTVTLTFAGYSNAQIYQDGVVKTVALTNGQVTLTLAEAAGAFVIPY